MRGRETRKEPQPCLQSEFTFSSWGESCPANQIKEIRKCCKVLSQYDVNSARRQERTIKTSNIIKEAKCGFMNVWRLSCTNMTPSVEDVPGHWSFSCFLCFVSCLVVSSNLFPNKMTDSKAPKNDNRLDYSIVTHVLCVLWLVTRILLEAHWTCLD